MQPPPDPPLEPPLEPPLSHVPASAAEIGHGRLAADLTVRDVLALPEVASYRDPAHRRQAARLALTEARRNSLDTLDPSWVSPRTWSDPAGRSARPADDVRRDVVDCDGTVWERHPDDRDSFGALPVDCWSPRRRAGEPSDDRSYSWSELIERLGPLTACARGHRTVRP
ncbi:hypothetical protein [Actinomadura violacea]|uniref:Uncharacterized protein n=1 Tax=Actinomadura violacea TaxID=2819934 RepID=A0ABS3RXG8_9ACTN|nr:hypothetical protein [Actinomadura violacea]MBO2461461.1 hypothetical protein [Actinomadura violacea]